VSFILKLGGGGGSEKTVITSNGQVFATRASIMLPPVIPSSTVGKYIPLSTRPVSLPFPIPKPTYTGGQSLFGGRFSLPQPSGLVQPYRPTITPFSGGGVSEMSAVPARQVIAPASQPSVPVVTQETVKTQSSSSSNASLWQGGLLLGPLVLGWLFGTKTIRHRRHRGLRHHLRRLRRPSFRRVRHRRHRR